LFLPNPGKTKKKGKYSRKFKSRITRNREKENKRFIRVERRIRVRRKESMRYTRDCSFNFFQRFKIFPGISI
jgi:hypothetical protein